MGEMKITAVGRRKLCKAHAGDIALPKITHIALGNGGLKENGEPKPVTGNEVELFSELLRREIDSHVFVDGDKGEAETTCGYMIGLSKADLAGEVISELGLYDSEGDLITYRTTSGKAKDGDEEFDFEVKEIF